MATIRAMHGRVDGLLVMSPYVDSGFLDDHLPGDLPIVLMNGPIRGSCGASHVHHVKQAPHQDEHHENEREQDLETERQ